MFKTQGAGIQYVHGGTSLQETIVPIIHVSELRSRTDIEVARPVSVRLKSITRNITNRSFTLEFEQMEKVEEKKETVRRQSPYEKFLSKKGLKKSAGEGVCCYGTGNKIYLELADSLSV